jgi:fatty-acyl-CoA synthase
VRLFNRLDQVLEAAVIAMPDARWGERPLLVVVPQPDAAGGSPASLADEVLQFMASHPDVAKFATPDACVVVKVGLLAQSA